MLNRILASVATSALAVGLTVAAQSGAQAATAGTDSLFGNATATAYDGGSSTGYEIGTVFTPRVNGTITQLRFYRVNPCDYGAVWGTLYQSNPFATTKSTKTVLGTTSTVNYANSATSPLGWQTLNFATPVAVTAGTQYTIARQLPHNCNANISNAFTSAKTVGNFNLPASASVYRNTTTGSVGKSTSNYLTDFTFSQTVTPPTTTAPSAPTNVAATAGNATATVTWSAPTSTGGSPVTGYTVRFKAAGAAAYGTAVNVGTANAFTVNGLTNGTSYSFVVNAVNAVGTSADSAVVSATPTAPVTGTIDVRSFGAVGDGVTDDTDAIQRALYSLKSGDTLVFPAGLTFRHTAVTKAVNPWVPGWVLTVTVPNVRLTGGGTLLGTAEQTSEFFINADNVKVDNLTFKKTGVTQRWSEYEKMGLRIGAHTGVTLTDVTVDGAAAAGLYIGGASNFTLTRVHVRNSKADGIHTTEGSHDGTLIDCDVTNAGDDGFAMVSYATSTPVNNITITNPKLFGQTWGRAFSVVGGKNITWNNVYAENSNAAAIYVAAEREWNSLPVSNVVFNGGTLKNSNTNSTVDHGAVLIYNSQTGTTNTDISLRNLTLTNTRASASRNVGIINNGGVNQRITMSGFTLTGGPSTAFYSNTATSAYNKTAWTVNGVTLLDQLGWA